MIGAVLRQELLLGGRRNRLHVFRWAFAGWLVVVVFYLYLRFEPESLFPATFVPGGRAEVVRVRVSVPSVVGQRFAEAFVVQQIFLLLLVTPAFVAGAITDEKRRGTLPQLLTTDLEARHVLVGKLLGRTAQVALIALTGLPPFALLAGFAGIGVGTALLVGAALVPPLFALAAASVLASVYCRQTRDAVLALYATGTALGLAVWKLGGPLDLLNPLYIVAPALAPGTDADLALAARRLAVSGGCWTVVGGACLGLAVARLWPAFRRELEGRRRAPGGVRDGRTPVDDNPVRWREGEVEGLAPSPGLRRVPRWLGLTLVASATTLSSLVILALNMPQGRDLSELLRTAMRADPLAFYAALPNAGAGFLVQSLTAMLLASLVVGVRCSGAGTGERERQTWESLLLSPLSVNEIIDGKLWGIFGASLWYLLAYAAPAVFFASLGGPQALFWVLLWLAVTVLAMYYVGAAGLWCSVRSRNSWRSLLGTLAAGYLGGIVLYLLTTPLRAIIGVILDRTLRAIDRTWGTQTVALLPIGWANMEVPFLIGSSVALAVIFWLMARTFLTHARRRVADRERTRHWAEEPIYRRSHRPRPPLGTARMGA